MPSGCLRINLVCQLFQFPSVLFVGEATMCGQLCYEVGGATSIEHFHTLNRIWTLDHKKKLFANNEIFQSCGKNFVKKSR